MLFRGFAHGCEMRNTWKDTNQWTGHFPTLPVVKYVLMCLGNRCLQPGDGGGGLAQLCFWCQQSVCRSLFQLLFCNNNYVCLFVFSKVLIACLMQAILKSFCCSPWRKPPRKLSFALLPMTHPRVERGCHNSYVMLSRFFSSAKPLFHPKEMLFYGHQKVKFPLLFCASLVFSVWQPECGWYSETAWCQASVLCFAASLVLSFSLSI